jgi:hypothetical protein
MEQQFNDNGVSRWKKIDWILEEAIKEFWGFKWVTFIVKDWINTDYGITGYGVSRPGIQN